jgi:hypothetical protein
MSRPETPFEAASYDLKQFRERRLADRRFQPRNTADRRKASLEAKELIQRVQESSMPKPDDDSNNSV